MEWVPTQGLNSQSKLTNRCRPWRVPSQRRLPRRLNLFSRFNQFNQFNLFNRFKLVSRFDRSNLALGTRRAFTSARRVHKNVL